MVDFENFTPYEVLSEQYRKNKEKWLLVSFHHKDYRRSFGRFVIANYKILRHLNLLVYFAGGLVSGSPPDQTRLKKSNCRSSMIENFEQMSFMFKIKLESGRGSFAFPEQLRPHLFQNFVRIRGMYSKTAHKDYVFIVSNLRDHP